MKPLIYRVCKWGSGGCPSPCPHGLHSRSLTQTTTYSTGTQMGKSSRQNRVHSIFFWLFYFFYFIFFFNFTILYWLCHISTWIRHRYTHVPHPELSSLSIPSLWVVPVHQPQATSIMHRTWTGDSFHIWYCTCFNAILPNHPTLSLSHRVQKTVLYICVSLAVLHTRLSLPSF